MPVGRLNLLSDRMRFGAAVGGVAFSVALILLIQALYAGYQESVKSFVTNVPADIWVGQAGAFDLFRSTSIVTPALRAQVAAKPGVQGMSELRGRQSSFTFDGMSIRSLFLGFSPVADEGVSKALGIERLPGPGEIIISDYIHKKSGLAKGDKVVVSGMELLVVDELTIKSPPFGSFSIINFDDTNTMFDMGGDFTYLLVLAQDRAAIPQMVTDMQTIKGVTVYEKSAFSASNSRTVDEFLPVIAVLLVVSYLVGVVITGLTIYTATIEKTRDYGVLKAIGASNSYVYRIVIFQSLAVSVLGFAIGFPLALLASRLAESSVPEFITNYEPMSVLFVFTAVLVMGLIASWLPVRRIIAIDPAIVFRA
ncbi:MAG: ABC transporter permease [Dehalococcoidia bacterium]